MLINSLNIEIRWWKTCWNCLHKFCFWHRCTPESCTWSWNLLQIIHGNQSCGGHIISFFIQAYKRALPVYLPVYLIPALIVHREGLWKRYWSSEVDYLILLLCGDYFILAEIAYKFFDQSFGFQISILQNKKCCG